MFLPFMMEAGWGRGVGEEQGERRTELFFSGSSLQNVLLLFSYSFFPAKYLFTYFFSTVYLLFYLSFQCLNFLSAKRCLTNLSFEFQLHRLIHQSTHFLC